VTEQLAVQLAAAQLVVAVLLAAHCARVHDRHRALAMMQATQPAAADTQ